MHKKFLGGVTMTTDSKWAGLQVIVGGAKSGHVKLNKGSDFCGCGRQKWAELKFNHTTVKKTIIVINDFLTCNSFGGNYA